MVARRFPGNPLSRGRAGWGGDPAVDALGEGEGRVKHKFQYWRTLDREAQNRVYAYIELAAYDAVRAGVPVFVDILSHPDASAAERIAAIYALAWFPEEAAQRCPGADPGGGRFEARSGC